MYFLRKYDNFPHKQERGVQAYMDAEITEILREQNEEFKKLYDEHKRLKQTLVEMYKNKYISPDEEIERKKLQKQKLLKKDRMAEMVRKYKQSTQR